MCPNHPLFMEECWRCCCERFIYDTEIHSGSICKNFVYLPSFKYLIEHIINASSCKKCLCTNPCEKCKSTIIKDPEGKISYIMLILSRLSPLLLPSKSKERETFTKLRSFKKEYTPVGYGYNNEAKIEFTRLATWLFLEKNYIWNYNYTALNYAFRSIFDVLICKKLIIERTLSLLEESEEE